MKHISLLPAAAAMLLLTACNSTVEFSVQTDTPAAQTDASAAQTDAPAAWNPESLPAITLTSENLHDGVWDDVISNTNKGANTSPQLKWEPVEGAACYAVYMVDTSVTYWLHWKSLNVTETELPAGAASAAEYVGPYPPSGTHDYEIRVFALKEPAAEEQSKFDNSNSGFDEMVAALDQTGSGTGNVLAYGTLSGSFTRS